MDHKFSAGGCVWLKQFQRVFIGGEHAVLVAQMNDRRKRIGQREVEEKIEGFQLEVARGEVIKIVEPDFAYGAEFFVVQKVVEIGGVEPPVRRFVRMDAAGEPGEINGVGKIADPFGVFEIGGHRH